MSGLPKPIDVSYEYTDSLDTAQQWLDSITATTAFDFEASRRYTDSQTEQLTADLDTTSDYLQLKWLHQQITSTALSFPYHVFPTHLSFASSDSEGRVIIISTHEMLDLVMEWLVTTDITQIWHNFNYDGKLIYYYSDGRLPKNIEDTALLAKTIANHVETYKAKVGLKELAGKWYGNWAISADHFDYRQMYDEKVLHYAAIDSAATFKLWTSINEYLDTEEGYTISTTTSDEYSPWDLLPAPEPRTESPPYGYFYDRVAKHFLKDTLRIQMNGLPIDLEKVRELEEVLDTTLTNVQTSLDSNPIIQRYQEARFKRSMEDYRTERLGMCREPSYFLRPFNYKNMDHRSYFMHVFAETNSIASRPTETITTGKPKWPAKLVKSLSSSRPILARLLDGQLTEENSQYVVSAMQLMAEDKAEIHNRKYIQQAESCEELVLEPFNPGSDNQKHDVLTDLLGYESDKLTDSYKKYEQDCRASKRFHRPMPSPPRNKYSWNRDNVEMIFNITTDEDELALCQALIDYSFGSIIKTNFIKAFYQFTIDDELHGSLKLFGAKTFRLTSSEP